MASANQLLMGICLTAKSYKGLQKKFANLPASTKNYLGNMEWLLENSSKYHIALAYAFMKIEEGHHRALKCGLVRLHECDSSKVDEALSKQHFTRSYFRSVFKNVLGKTVPDDAQMLLMNAESVRDRLIHGKGVSAPDLRTGLSAALDYVAALGGFVEERTGKNPFGDLRGLKGRKELLDPTTSYWVMKGVGLYSDGPKL